MDNDIFKKGIAEIRNMRLSEKERSFILGTILRGRVRSPYWSVYSFAMQIRQRALYARALAVVLLLAGGGTVVLAAERSVPGDMLYPVKVNVTEPALDRLYTAAEDKARWQGEKTARRLREAETLALEGRLDGETIKVIEEKIQEHRKTFRESVSSISTTTEPEKRESIEVEYESKLKAHARILDRIKEDFSGGARETLERVEETLAEELEKNQEREEERAKEKKDKARDEGRATKEQVRQRLQDAATSAERAALTIQRERSELRDVGEAVRKDVLEESRQIIDETRNKIRNAREAKERGTDGDESAISELEDSERKIFEINTMLKELRKVQAEKRKDEREKRRERENGGRKNQESEG